MYNKKELNTICQILTFVWRARHAKGAFVSLGKTTVLKMLTFLWRARHATGVFVSDKNSISENDHLFVAC